MADPQKNPEKQQGNIEPQKKPMDEATRTVLGKFDEIETEQVGIVEKMFEDKISRSKLPEVALGDMIELKEAQKTIVRATVTRFKHDFQEQSQENISERDLLAQQLLERAKIEAESRIQRVQLVLSMLIKGDYATPEEAAALKRTLAGIEKISASDIETQQILIKLQKHAELSAEDYDHIVKMINPLDLTAKDSKPRAKFEATSAGILIGFMTGAQRYRLIQELMDSPKRGQTAEVIDAFLRTGILSIAQGEELFQIAVQKKIIDETEFKDTYRKRLDQGFYVDEVKKVKDAMDQEIRRMKGMYDTNMMERVTGAPLLGAGMLLHSFFWILTNVLAAGGDFKTMFKRNPYIWAALGEGALALEMTSGSIKKGSGSLGIGSGWITRLCERISEKEGPLNTAKQNAYALIGDIYLNYPDMGAYLENGGAGRILEVRNAKTGQGKQGKDLIITFDELLQSETNPDQQARLKDANRKFPQKTEAQINGMGEALMVTEMKTQEEFNGKLAIIKQDQGLTGGSASAGAALPAQPQVVAS